MQWCAVSGWTRLAACVVVALMGACSVEPEGPARAGADAGVSGGADAGADAPEACPSPRSCNGGRVCCAAGEECVEGFLCLAECANERCGDNGSLCCGATQTCVDGLLCGARCEAGRARCGAALEVCCGAGEVCLDDACVAPGATCEDDYDCLEEGSYCEATIAHCLPLPEVVPACELRPTFEEIELEVEWHWPGITISGKLFENVVGAPVVGDVSGDGIPDVVVAAYYDDNLGDTILVALDGRPGVPEGRVLWTIGGTSAENALEPNFDTQALANMDADPALEVIYQLRGGGVRIIDGDGVTELGRRTGGGSIGGSHRWMPVIADLNADGTPDVVAGCHALDGRDIGDPTDDLFDQGACVNGDGAITLAADLDGDGDLEITSGGVAFRSDGTLLWERSGRPHGYPAVGDLDLDGAPEVVVVRSGSIVVVDGLAGTMRIGPGGTWVNATFALPGGGVGGPPTIADFDNDGAPEISTAGRGQYIVYDPDCLPAPPRAGGRCASGRTDFIQWVAPTQDISSSATGSSVFDFQGDGVAEVIYNDECFLHIYDGESGEEILAAPRPNSSRTAYEYPVVVDVDRDGNSEIVVPANRDQIGRDECEVGTSGVFVFGDPGDRWVRTRPIWNQHTYHVTNVSDVGEVPATEMSNWLVPGLNNYRTNVQGAGVFNAPNLAVELSSVARCGSATVRLVAAVENRGSRGVPAGVLVEFFRTMPTPETLVGTGTTSAPLLPGETARVVVDVAEQPFDTELFFEVRVDGASSSAPVMECDEGDNSASATEMCPGIG